MAIVAGHIHESEKTRIYGKGAEMYKSIYKKVHNTGVAWLYLNDGGVVLIRVGGIKIYRGSSVVRVRLC